MPRSLDPLNQERGAKPLGQAVLLASGTRASQDHAGHSGQRDHHARLGYPVYFGPGLPSSEDSVRVLIDTVPRAVRRAFRPDSSLRQPIWYRFIVTEPLSISNDIVFAAEGTRVEIPTTENAEATADVTFRRHGETYVLVMYGHFKPGQVIADGRMTVVGDMEVAAGFGGKFKAG